MHDGVRTGTIVVGVDGSDESKDALRWALAEARLRRARLRCVHAWILPPLFDPSGIAGSYMREVRETLQQEATELLGAVVAELAAGFEDVDVEQIVAEGPAARVLTEAAAGADLLVVGSRGLGGFAGLRLGSVSHQGSQHASCPVAIVR